MKKELSIVLIAHNEEQLIERVVRDYHEKIAARLPSSELIVCEDGSHDGTPAILKRLGRELSIRVYSSKKRKGYLLAASDALMKARGKIIFFSDADGEHDPSDFWKLYDLRADADLISGSRPMANRSLARLALSSGFSAMVGIFFDARGFDDYNSGFKLMSMEVRDRIVPKVNLLKYGFSTELIIRCLDYGFKVKQVPVSYEQRKSKGRDFDLLKLPEVVIVQSLGMARLRYELKS